MDKQMSGRTEKRITPFCRFLGSGPKAWRLGDRGSEAGAQRPGLGGRGSGAGAWRLGHGDRGSETGLGDQGLETRARRPGSEAGARMPGLRGRGSDAGGQGSGPRGWRATKKERGWKLRT